MARVPLLTAAILGFATFHHAIGSSAFAGDGAVVIRRLHLTRRQFGKRLLSDIRAIKTK